MADNPDDQDAERLRRAESALQAQPQAFRKLRDLCFGVADADGFYLDFVLAVEEIIAKYKAWHPKSAKQQEVSELTDALRNAEDPAVAFGEVLQRLDQGHAELW